MQSASDTSTPKAAETGKRRNFWMRYGLAVLSVVLAGVVSRQLESITPTAAPLLLAAVAVTSWYGGLGPGLLATALSELVFDLFLPPAPTARAVMDEALRLGVFGLVAVLIGSLYAARRLAESALGEALEGERAALAEAEAANQHKDRFLSILAHELRTPLATVRNVAEVLARKSQDPATLQWGEEILQRQIRQMSRLLEDLLDVSRIGQGKVELRREPLDLTALVDAVVQDERGLFESRGLALQAELPAGPVWVLGDSARLIQVLNNLLTNAGKFTDPGGTITVSLRKSADGAWAVVSVRDTGLGIEPDVLPHIFELFAQAERTRERSRGGLGLGLALVKGFIELHGGKVTVTSEGRGQGAEFTVWLPLSRQPALVHTGHVSRGPDGNSCAG